MNQNTETKNLLTNSSTCISINDVMYCTENVELKNCSVLKCLRNLLIEGLILQTYNMSTLLLSNIQETSRRTYAWYLQYKQRCKKTEACKSISQVQVSIQQLSNNYDVKHIHPSFTITKWLKIYTEIGNKKISQCRPISSNPCHRHLHLQISFFDPTSLQICQQTTIISCHRPGPTNANCHTVTQVIVLVASKLPRPHDCDQRLSTLITFLRAWFSVTKLEAGKGRTYIIA